MSLFGYHGPPISVATYDMMILKEIKRENERRKEESKERSKDDNDEEFDEPPMDS